MTLRQPGADFIPPASFQGGQICFQQGFSSRTPAAAMTNTIPPNHANRPGFVGFLSYRLVSPSSLFDCQIEHFQELLKAFRRIGLEPQWLFCLWLVPIVPMFIDLWILFAKLPQLFVKSAVPFSIYGLGIHSMRNELETY